MILQEDTEILPIQILQDAYNKGLLEEVSEDSVQEKPRELSLIRRVPPKKSKKKVVIY